MFFNKYCVLILFFFSLLTSSFGHLFRLLIESTMYRIKQQHFRNSMEI